MIPERPRLSPDDSVAALEPPREGPQARRVHCSPGGSNLAHMKGNAQSYSATMGWGRTKGNDPRVERLPDVEAWRMEESLEHMGYRKGQHRLGVDRDNVPLIA
jgi:hypothetical protein